MTRIAKALSSDDLTHYPDPSDVDVVGVCGATRIRRNLGVLLVEVREACAGESSDSVSRVRELRGALAGRVVSLAKRWKFRVNAIQIAAYLIKELILDRCPQCHGRGVIPMRYDGQRMIALGHDDLDKTEDVECTLCLGSGAARRDFEGRARAAGHSDYSRRLGEFWEALLTSLADSELNARKQIYRRLGRPRGL